MARRPPSEIDRVRELEAAEALAQERPDGHGDDLRAAYRYNYAFPAIHGDRFGLRYARTPWQSAIG